jgi:hypothetical protein
MISCKEWKGSALDKGQVKCEVEKNIFPVTTDNILKKTTVQILRVFLVTETFPEICRKQWGGIKGLEDII